jgi:hypothetical protein
MPIDRASRSRQPIAPADRASRSRQPIAPAAYIESAFCLNLATIDNHAAANARQVIGVLIVPDRHPIGSSENAFLKGKTQ